MKVIFYSISIIIKIITYFLITKIFINHLDVFYIGLILIVLGSLIMDVHTLYYLIKNKNNNH